MVLAAIFGGQAGLLICQGMQASMPQLARALGQPGLLC